MTFFYFYFYMTVSECAGFMDIYEVFNLTCPKLPFGRRNIEFSDTSTCSLHTSFGKKTQNSFVLRKKILFQWFCGVHFSWPRPWFIFHTMTLDRVVLPGRRSWTTPPHRATGKYDMYDDFILQSNNHVNFPFSEVNQVISSNNKRELAIASAWCTRFMHQWYQSN